MLRHEPGASFALRAKVDGAWSEWQEPVAGEFGASGEHWPDAAGPDEEGFVTGRPTTGLYWLGPGAESLNVVARGDNGSASNVEVIMIDTSLSATTPGAADPSPAAPNLGAVARPAIQQRDAWASASWDYENDSCDDGPSEMGYVAAVAVHHTVTTNRYRQSEVDDILRGIYGLHVGIWGWCDIGYNFVIDRFGGIWEARTGSVNGPTIGGHARGFNSTVVGISMLGQHHPGASPSSETPTGEASAALASIAGWVLGIHGVDPAGHTWLYNRSNSPPLRLEGHSWHYVPTIVGHRELGSTSCPGDSALPIAHALRNTLADERDRSLPVTIHRWLAKSHGPGFAAAAADGGVRPAGSASPWANGPTGLQGGAQVVAVDGDLRGGFSLLSDGAVRGYGDRAAVVDIGNRIGGAAAVDIVAASAGNRGWVLGSDGTLNGFGGASNLAASGGRGAAVAASVNPADASQALVLYESGTLGTTSGVSGWGSAPAAGLLDLAVDWAGGRGYALDRDGLVVGLGSAAGERHRPLPDGRDAAPVAALVAGREPGGWVLDSAGQLWPFGGARRILPISTVAKEANIVDGAQTGFVLTADFFDSDDARYVAALYELFEGRAPTDTELERAVAQLEGGIDRTELVGPLALSEHWAGSRIAQMYRSVLGRGPDREGRTYWLERLRDGMPFAELGTYFYGSDEYYRAAGSSERYVGELYRALLHREPDPEGLAYWVGRLDSNRASPPDVAYGYYVSVESRRDRASVLYRQILRRNPTAEELAEAAESLLETDDVKLATDLGASSDFYDLAADA